VPTPPPSSAPSARPRSARGKGEELREELLDAATELLDETGDPARLTIRAVTKRAGVSPMALYLHFADRDELLAALLDRGFARFRRRLHEAVAHADGPQDMLLATGRAYVRFALDEPALYAFMFGPWHPEAADEEQGDGGPGQGAAAFDDIVALVTYLMDEGVVPPGDARTTAMGVWTTVHGFVTLRHCMAKMEWPSTEDMLARTVEAWLTPRAGAAAT
jgi:AcrR family transcriptional regulator